MENYRGYEIERNPKSGYYVVTLNGKAVTSQPSLEFAMKWIDLERRRQHAEERNK